jgi:hypothetical protein
MEPTASPVRSTVLWQVHSTKKFVLTLPEIADNVSALSHGDSLQVAYAHATQFTYRSCCSS